MNNRTQAKSEKNWLNESARDLLALGSLPFFVLVLVRVFLLDNPAYFAKFLVSGFIFIIVCLILKADLYSGLGFITLFFTNLYYQDLKYLVFSLIIYILLIFSLFYLKESWKKILKGIVFGIICTLISYYAINLFIR
ncbi:MAG: hypothetical protein NT076_00935 [Candidatus Pacearchaeota archaeon]|nr:hypothetical protein [Candidatus Pacearchaeota archaeon]